MSNKYKYILIWSHSYPPYLCSWSVIFTGGGGYDCHAFLQHASGILIFYFSMQVVIVTGFLVCYHTSDLVNFSYHSLLITLQKKVTMENCHTLPPPSPHVLNVSWIRRREHCAWWFDTLDTLSSEFIFSCSLPLSMVRHIHDCHILVPSYAVVAIT